APAPPSSRKSPSRGAERRHADSPPKARPPPQHSQNREDSPAARLPGGSAKRGRRRQVQEWQPRTFSSQTKKRKGRANYSKDSRALRLGTVSRRVAIVPR